ncbi:hypothetical protein OP862_16465 [Yersinia massiliensis]|jgi:hypothetical protein|uniref:Uncharacterized protein n=1 Tax=Yersinia massiliensis TaxID=419257 RepID=A0A2R4NSW9_9GAMM|nr:MULTISPECIES: hypothetical protein [Yersinia]HEC1649689.1 hypothetical protein [Yersinia enterocolitica]ATM84930.1 hypothetical protein CRN74_01845 [Yersinia frederiksenii]AVX39186.1 hypothetical protein DA391_16825 [Yersinia massiliensis]MCB5319052.1 hypothetical protein [Yersinia massiliensis]MDA5548065.1 hypothetical protein [Yersinia massiliensis]
MLDKTALILVSVLTTSLMLSTSTAAAEIPAQCRALSPGEWKASVNMQQSGPAKLIVLGEVETSTGGYEVTLEHGETELNPAIVTLDLKIVPPPADAMVSQMITPHAVKAEVPEVSRDLKRVVINCGEGKLMEITEISVLN